MHILNLLNSAIASQIILDNELSDHDSCPIDVPWSCSTKDEDSCCYEGTNGLFMLTQFWDYQPASGPNDQFTIHGLWCDRCAGGFNQFCNPSWAIKDAKDVLLSLGLESLVYKLSEIWKNQYKSDNELWTHEFNKHGTCMSTVSPHCYANTNQNQAPHLNVGDFFKSAVRLHESLPTYQWLEQEGILPSTDKTWSVDEFSSAIAKHADGKVVYLGCDRRNNLNEIWYYHYLRGSVADGEFKLVDSISTSSCGDGFKYLPKGHNGNDNGGGGDDDGHSKVRGALNVVNDDNDNLGCLISDGSWFTSGTCASFRFKETIGGIQLSSSRGPCGIVNDVLTCNNHLEPTDFELNNENYLTYGGSAVWGAHHSPKKYEKVHIAPGANTVSIKLNYIRS